VFVSQREDGRGYFESRRKNPGEGIAVKMLEKTTPPLTRGKKNSRENDRLRTEMKEGRERREVKERKGAYRRMSTGKKRHAKANRVNTRGEKKAPCYPCRGGKKKG